jgi:hypothetical protein
MPRVLERFPEESKLLENSLRMAISITPVFPDPVGALTICQAACTCSSENYFNKVP